MSQLEKLKMPFVRDNPTGLSFVVLKKQREVVIPRSLVLWRRKYKTESGQEMVDFNLPAWKVKQEGLEDYLLV